MPPAPIKTVRDLMYWQYAKIISDSAGFGKENWGFIMKKFKDLQQGEIFWNGIREYVLEKERKDVCIYCGSTGKLTLEHLFPHAHHGPDTEKNLVWICKSCNSIKGPRRLYEFYTLQHDLHAAKYDVPRIAEGKYLKLLYELFKEQGKLDLNIEDMKADVCPCCDMTSLCKREHSVGKLSPLCLDGIATLAFKGTLRPIPG